MSGYRFCRTDDVPLLVDAYNDCCAGHFEKEPLTVEGFKRAARELNIWASSCMLALAGSVPIGVLLCGKRESESLIYRIGIRPEHRRKGHGRHLLASLQQKLAILGPPRLVVEVAARSESACRFFESCGYRVESHFADFSRAPSAAGGEAQPMPRAEDARDLVTPITLDELRKSEAFDEKVERSWERTLATLVNRKGELQGLAVASDSRIEAHLLHRQNRERGAREIVALGFAPGAGETLLSILVRLFLAGEPGEVVVPRISESEIRFSLLETWGFRRDEEILRYATMAAPG
jgi:ribosomal protein S18 acetylase RimI-like enzyme